MNKATFTIQDDKKTLVVERIFNAPKSQLWNAYTNADALAAWWGPKGWETEVPHFDFKEGGEWRYIMKCVDEAQGEWFGKTAPGKMVFKSITPEDSIEYSDYFTDDDGNIVEGMPTSQTVLQFEENEDGSTTLIATTSYADEAALKQVLEMGMEQGYAETLDKLEEYVTR